MSLFHRFRRFLIIFFVSISLLAPQPARATLEDLVTTSTVVSTLAPIVGGAIAFLFTKCSRACWGNIFACCRDCRESCCSKCGKPRPLHAMAQSLENLDGDLVTMLDLFGKALDENVALAQHKKANAEHVTNEATNGSIYAFATQAFEVTNLNLSGNAVSLGQEKRYIKDYFLLDGKISTLDSVMEALLEGANPQKDRGRWEAAYFEHVRKRLGSWFTRNAIKILHIKDEATGLSIFYLGDTHGDGFEPYVRIAMYTYPPEGRGPSHGRRSSGAPPSSDEAGDGTLVQASTIVAQIGENEFTKRLTARYWRQKHEMRYRAMTKRVADFEAQDPDEARVRSLASTRISDLLASIDDGESRRRFARQIAALLAGSKGTSSEPVALLVPRRGDDDGYTSDTAAMRRRVQSALPAATAAAAADAPSTMRRRAHGHHDGGDAVAATLRAQTEELLAAAASSPLARRPDERARGRGAVSERDAANDGVRHHHRRRAASPAPRPNDEPVSVVIEPSTAVAAAARGERNDRRGRGLRLAESATETHDIELRVRASDDDSTTAAAAGALGADEGKRGAHRGRPRTEARNRSSMRRGSPPPRRASEMDDDISDAAVAAALPSVPPTMHVATAGDRDGNESDTSHRSGKSRSSLTSSSGRRSSTLHDGDD